MATIQRYQSPPNWPVPPPDWAPPPGWQPDPAWGPAPPDWQFWRAERANPNAWGRAFAAAGILAAGFFVVGLVLALTLGGGGVSARAAGTIFGQMLGRGLLAGLFTALIAYNTATRWRFWVYLLVAFGFTLVLSVVTNAASLGGA